MRQAVEQKGSVKGGSSHREVVGLAEEADSTCFRESCAGGEET